MWPSLPLANHIADVANIFFIGSLVVGVISTVLIVWMANVKEGHWELARQASEERIAFLAAQGEGANAALGTAQADIAKANAQIAEANARALEAQADLEKFKAPRFLGPMQRALLVSKLKPFAGQKFTLSVASDPEAIALLGALKDILATAGWEKLVPQIGDIVINDAGQAFGVGVRLHIPPDSAPPLIELVKLLTAALNAEGIASLAQFNASLKITGAVNVMVGTKPATLPLTP